MCTINVLIYSLDANNFTTCLLLRMLDLLKQRDNVLYNSDKWAIDSASDRQKLQASFTLVNSIMRLVDVQLHHILTYMIHQANIHENVKLLLLDNLWLQKLWLSLFSNEGFLRLSYETVATGFKPTTNISEYECQFPFSWEIFDQVQGLINSIILHERGYSALVIIKLTRYLCFR